MKNLSKIAIIWCVLAVALLCSCPDDSGGNDPGGNNPTGFPVVKGKMTINGLSDFNGKYVYVSGLAGSSLITGLTDITGYITPDMAFKLPQISGGKVEAPLYTPNPQATSYANSYTAYSGNDTITSMVSIYIVNDSSVKASNAQSAITNNLGTRMLTSGTFSNGNMTIDWGNAAGGNGNDNGPYTVTFNADGGTPPPDQQIIADGGNMY